MASSPRHIRIFVSSPGDVADERSIALQVIDQLPYDPLLRGRVTFEVVAWDKQGGGVPMLATMTPQAAIDAGLPKPSECDIVVLIFWARMGTPLPHPDYQKADGRPYWSGTEWEYEDAMRAARQFKRPEVVIYRRTEEPVIGLKDPQRVQKIQQWERVETFFAQFTDSKTEAILQGHNSYAKPEDFRRDFEMHLKVLVRRLLDTLPAPEQPQAETPKPVELWKGSPFPGLRAFTPADSPIFFGRGRETDALVKKVAESRFVAVMGASGSGKSSLVGAGLIPRLKGNAIEGSKDWLLLDYEGHQWQGLRFTPGEVGDDPFMALAVKLAPLVGSTPREVSQQLATNASDAKNVIERALAGKEEWAEALLFIDQFEELFTLVGEQYREPFVELLSALKASQRVRVVVTMRSDFYHRCVDIPLLAELLEQGSFPLSVAGQIALYEMITRPAERAGLIFEEGLPEVVLQDTGREPGALALLAYALDELYQLREQNGELTTAHYESIGKVQGAIGKRAETTFSHLDESAQNALLRVFRELIEIDERGTATRKRALQSRAVAFEGGQQFIAAFTDARLLTTSREGKESIVEVAHEALLRSWPRLAAWIEAVREDFRQLRLGQIASGEWERSGGNREYLWDGVQLERLQAAVKVLQPTLSRTERWFVGLLKFDDLMAVLEDKNISRQQRMWVDSQLVQIGDPRPGVGLQANGLPDIAWCEVPPGEYPLGGDKGAGQPIARKSKVKAPYYISRYLITYRQFQTFVDAADGFHNPDWWQGLSADDHHKREPDDQAFKFLNHPRECVSWYDAVAFCRWLSEKLGYEVRLPTEQEWEAAARGKEGRLYPYGNDFDASKANTYETGIGQTSAVGIFPEGASPFGVEDMSGNVWEWCMNEYENPEKISFEGTATRVLRGGSFSSAQDLARAASRINDHSDARGGIYGFRLMCLPPSQ